MRRRVPWALRLVLLPLLLASCSRVPPLEHTQPSREALAQAVLDAFERRDTTRLDELALSEREFRNHVWGELPAARPERSVPFGYAWGDLRQKSQQSLRARLAEYGGRQYTLQSVTFTGGTTQYDTYLVHREALLTVRAADGTSSEIRLFGSALEEDGGWKVFSYVTED